MSQRKTHGRSDDQQSVNRAKQMKGEIPSPKRSSPYTLEDNVLIRLGLSKKKVHDPMGTLRSKQSSWQDRVLAIQMLVEQADDPAKANAIEERIQNENEEEVVRIAAIQALGQLRKANRVPEAALLRLITMKNPVLRATAIETLASLDLRKSLLQPAVIRGLTNTLLDKQTAIIVRVALIRLLATFGTSAPIKEIVALLDEANVDARIRAAIVESLDASQTAIFERELNDQEQSIRVSAAYRLGIEKAITKIVEVLENDRENVYVDRAAQLLGEVGKGTDDEFDALTSLAQNQLAQTSARISAILALGQLYERYDRSIDSSLGIRRLQRDSNKDIQAAAEAVVEMLHSDSEENFEEHGAS